MVPSRASRSIRRSNTVTARAAELPPRLVPLVLLQSLTNGANGARSRHVTTRTSRRVANAARLSSVYVIVARRGLSRTYQFETSSTKNVMMSRAAVVAS